MIGIVWPGGPRGALIASKWRAAAQNDECAAGRTYREAARNAGPIVWRDLHSVGAGIEAVKAVVTA